MSDKNTQVLLQRMDVSDQNIQTILQRLDRIEVNQEKSREINDAFQKSADRVANLAFSVV